jgi:hypothetical protein
VPSTKSSRWLGVIGGGGAAKGRARPTDPVFEKDVDRLDERIELMVSAADDVSRRDS